MPKNKLSKKPFVSICTPTFNRRPFFPYIIKCFENQTYPKDKMEWIIIDDGTDKIEDLVKHIPQVKYFKYDEKLMLGKKRNLAHEKASGEIIISMDDDDYYPANRVSHAVDMLRTNPNAMCAGSSEMHIYFKHIQTMYKFGPYGPNHSTAATFAFRKELLKETKYDDEKALAEETQFTKGYTIPLIQLDTLKSILVFSHKHNSLNKEKLLENPQASKTILSKYKVDDFIKDPVLKQFYMFDMNKVLENYEPGRPENKPEVMDQIKQLEEDRSRRIEEHNKIMDSQNKFLSHINKPISKDIINEYEQKMSEKNYLINELLKKVKILTLELEDYKSGKK
jgi:glycosyltransferase involved in cell wall biosynthesis